ncbi:MAG: 2,3-bisphosphoglycerate-independent phosphoglycerate mutase, partial [Flavobacteriales bacterium]
MNRSKVGLIILDGWGIGDQSDRDAIHQARTPVTDELNRVAPHATLRTDGEFVGLPEGQMGNSEVGHMNIGAGRVVYQDLVRIHVEIRDGLFQQQPALIQAFKHAASHTKRIHFMGLVSDGGVHSHINHALALSEMAKSHPDVQAFMHAFTDGRDTDPKSGIDFLRRMVASIDGSNVHLASVVGRYYAMDRDKRWERISKAYQLLVNGEGNVERDVLSALQTSYDAGITDEFIEPMRIDMNGLDGRIQPGDVVICFNFRTDRCREITEVLTQHSMPEFNMQILPLYYVTMTNYDDQYRGVHVVYDKDNLTKTLGEVVADAGLSQVRIAETEKYPHVTFFFSGGREALFEGEERAMIPSPKVATYDLQPEMSAVGITDKMIELLNTMSPDFFCLNYANADMVGHTGVFSSIVSAVETVDRCLGNLMQAALEKHYALIIIADHGNADMALNPDGTPNTAHTTNPVPVWVVAEGVEARQDG